TDKIIFKLTIGSPSNEKAPANANLITYLTEPQKKRLLAVLLSANELKGGEIFLIDLVKSWNDERLLPFLLNRLRNEEPAPSYNAAVLMMKISEILNEDETLQKAFENYMERATYEDLETEEAVKQEPKEKESQETDSEDDSSQEKKTPLDA